MQLALKRLSAKESYDRIYRIRRSIQCSYQHKLLPKDQWTKAEEVNTCNRLLSIMMNDQANLFLLQDISYLRPILAQVEAELAEKDALDSMNVIKSH